MAESVVVTGGAGFIGSHLVERLVQLGYHVVVIDDLSAGSVTNLPHSDLVHFFQADVRESSLKAVYREFRPQILFHLAAHFANELSIREPQQDLQVNTLGTLAQLELARAVGIRRFVFASSSCVYGRGRQPLREGDRLDPHTPYAIAKLAAEQYCRFFSTYHGLPATILRYFNVYGPRDPAGEYRNVIPHFLNRASARLPLIVLGTGEETRDFTYVSDAVSATVEAALRLPARDQTINVGTGRETSLLELVDIIRGLAGSVQIQFKPRRHWDATLHRLASVDKARNLLGYVPSVPLEQGLALTWDWYTASTKGAASQALSEPDPGSIQPLAALVGTRLEEGGG